MHVQNEERLWIRPAIAALGGLVIEAADQHDHAAVGLVKDGGLSPLCRPIDENITPPEARGRCLVRQFWHLSYPEFLDKRWIFWAEGEEGKANAKFKMQKSKFKKKNASTRVNSCGVPRSSRSRGLRSGLRGVHS